MNAFSAAIRITNGGIVISFKDTDIDSQENSDRYSTEMLEICQENGFTPLIPQYIPSHLEPKEQEWGTVVSHEKNTTVHFGFAHKKESVQFGYYYLLDPSYDLEIGIPLHAYEYTPETICDISIRFFKVSETEFRAIFKADQVIYTIWTDGIDELETRKILHSMFLS